MAALHWAPGAAPQWQVLVWAGRVSVCAYRPATLDAVTRSEGAWGCRRSIHRELMYWPFFRAYSWKTPISTNPNFRCRATDALLGMAMPHEDGVHGFVVQEIEQLTVQGGSDSLPLAAIVEPDAHLHCFPERLLIPVALAAGVAENLLAPAGDEYPVRARRCELLEPVAPFFGAEGPRGEPCVGGRGRVVLDVDDAGQIACGRRCDFDGRFVHAGGLLESGEDL